MRRDGHIYCILGVSRLHLLVECGKVNVRLLHVRTLYSCASERVKLAVLQVGRWIMLPIPDPTREKSDDVVGLQ